MRNRKRPVERILVAKVDQNAIATGAVFNDAGVCQLNDGQIAVVAPTTTGGSTDLTDAASTVTDAYAYTGSVVGPGTSGPTIQFFQGTPYSGSPQTGDPTKRTHEKSEIIYGKGVVSADTQQYVVPNYDAIIIGDETGNSQIGGTSGTIEDETEYALRVNLRGIMKDYENTQHGRDSFIARYTTPDYTALGTVDPRDHLIQNLVNEINTNYSKMLGKGRYEVVAFAVNTDGTASAGVLVSALDNLAGAVATGYGFSTDAETKSGYANSVWGNTFVQVAADTDNDVDTSSKIVPIDLATAGDGSTAKANAIMIVGIDRDFAYEDRIEETKTRLEVDALEGFDTTTVGNYRTPYSEGQGTPRFWKQYIKDTFNQRKYSQARGGNFYPIIETSTYIDDDEAYNVFTFVHNTTAQIGPADFSVSPHKTIILVPKAATTLDGDLDSIVTNWFGSTPALS